jgi:glycosyltransferase involved in cell wall biosynthesis
MEVLSKTEITGEKAIKKGISVIVCTFNGSSRLAQTIQHVAAQVTRNQIQWEVIFVDNASTDNSTEVVGKEWTKHGPKDVKLSLLKEERPGKIFALEQAFSTAKYEYAIICDDDNWLNPDYLELAYEILEQDDSIGAVGGRSAAKNDSGIFPVWFDNFTESYAVGEQALSTSDVTDDRGYLWGAGLATRTLIYREMYNGFPSLLTGRLGESLAAGEDAEYCQRLILRGYKLYYDSRLFFHHYMPDSRLTEEYRERLFAGFAASNLVLSKYYIASRYVRNYKLNSKKRLSFFSAVTLFKLLFASNKQRRDDARTALVFTDMLPANPNSVISKISSFYKKGIAKP